MLFLSTLRYRIKRIMEQCYTQKLSGIVYVIAETTLLLWDVTLRVRQKAVQSALGLVLMQNQILHLKIYGTFIKLAQGIVGMLGNSLKSSLET